MCIKPICENIAVKYVHPSHCYVGLRLTLESDFVVYVLACSFPPEGRIFSAADCSDLWGCFGDDVAKASGKGDMIVAGDLNARTAALLDWLEVVTLPPA